jgi:hypothetical protein
MTMGSPTVTGLSPLTFVSEDKGDQVQIPLSSLTIGSNNAINADAWLSTMSRPGDKALLDVLIPDLQKRGVITVSAG